MSTKRILVLFVNLLNWVLLLNGFRFGHQRRWKQILNKCTLTIFFLIFLMNQYLTFGKHKLFENFKWLSICVSFSVYFVSPEYNPTFGGHYGILYFNEVTWSTLFLILLSSIITTFLYYREMKSDELYRGIDNYLQKEIVVETTFQCQFDLGMYPFDTQRCELKLKSTQRSRSVLFRSDSIEFLVRLVSKREKYIYFILLNAFKGWKKTTRVSCRQSFRLLFNSKWFQSDSFRDHIRQSFQILHLRNVRESIESSIFFLSTTQLSFF